MSSKVHYLSFTELGQAKKKFGYEMSAGQPAGGQDKREVCFYNEI